jgi:hypothetical protein
MPRKTRKHSTSDPLLPRIHPLQVFDPAKAGLLLSPYLN